MKFRSVLFSLSILFGSLGAAGSAQASIVTWNLNSHTGNLGTTEIYTSNGISIIAAGFTNSTFNHPTDLYGKNFSGDEKGLGLTNDPTHDNEISGSNIIRIDFTNARTAGLTGFSFSMDSVSRGEDWIVYGSNSSTSGLTVVATGSDEILHSLNGAAGSYEYYFFADDSRDCDGNVLLGSVSGITAAVPEPSTWAMMVLGFAAIGFTGFRQRVKSVVAA